MCSLNLSANVLPDSAINPSSQSTLQHLLSFLEDGISVLGVS